MRNLKCARVRTAVCVCTLSVYVNLNVREVCVCRAGPSRSSRASAIRIASRIGIAHPTVIADRNLGMEPNAEPNRNRETKRRNRASYSAKHTQKTTPTHTAHTVANRLAAAWPAAAVRAGVRCAKGIRHCPSRRATLKQAGTAPEASVPPSW